MSASSHLDRQYGPPTGPYRVVLKNAVGWQNYNHLRLRISVGSPTSEGAKFFAFAEWACRRFETIEFIIGDTLQRHNTALEHKLSMPVAWTLSRNAGDEWINRNREALALIPHANLVRWDSLLADSRYAIARARFAQHYMTSSAFKDALDKTINIFWQRNAERFAHCQKGFFAASYAFLMEELAIFSFQCAEAGLDAYAGSWLTDIFDALALEEDIFFDAFRKPWLQVDFARNKAFVETIERQAA